MSNQSTVEKQSTGIPPGFTHFELDGIPVYCEGRTNELYADLNHRQG